MHLLREAIEAGNLWLDLSEDQVEPIFDHVLDHLVDSNVISHENRGVILTELLSNESVSSSALSDSVAIPHVYIDELSEPIIYFVRLAHPANLGAADGIATRFIFFLLGPTHAGSEHLNTLAAITSLASDDEFRYDIGKSKSKHEFLSAMDRFQQRHPKQYDEETSQAKSGHVGLEFTGKFGGGVREDIARRLPHYWNDFTEGFNLKCVGSIFFLLFACLAPAVLFAGLMGVYTDN
jgi:mannitol/fructose-specific phosphotransferase system IIA component (Ntr-type)